MIRTITEIEVSIQSLKRNHFFQSAGAETGKFLEKVALELGPKCGGSTRRNCKKEVKNLRDVWGEKIGWLRQAKFLANTNT